LPLSANNFVTETSPPEGHSAGEQALARVQERYAAARPESRRLWEQARGVLPGGVSGAAKAYAPFPVFIDSASGARAVDVDGNEYVDLLMGAGPMLLGHGHPRVLEAVERQLRRCTNPMLPTRLSLALAERIRGHMPYLERLRFVNTGSEATRSAVRVARAIAGPPARARIAKCEGAFHGSDDQFLVSAHTRAPAGSAERPQAVADYAGLLAGVEEAVLVLPYNDARAAAALIDEHAHELAAVIVEPLAFSSGGGVPATREFARALREATARHGIVLIFDEVLCAYRLGLAGAPAYLGVTPDLSAIGKALGGGMPLAAFGGRADLMEAAFGEGERDGQAAGAGGASAVAPQGAQREIFQSGTFTENPVSIAAGLAVLDVLESEPVLERADRTGALLREGLREQFAAHGVTAAVTGAASIVQVHVGVESVADRRDVLRADAAATRALQLGMVTEGVLWPPGHPAVTSGAHSDEDIATVITTVGKVLSK
jgi:glutamate-1-semialdehyde 2,1-aminomutase